MLDYAIPNIAELADRVEEWQGKNKPRVIWQAQRERIRRSRIGHVVESWPLLITEMQ